ncbi:hypothetical protein NO1_2017 [Candidatus Termititenax aidoneus]|uniref:Uncharacterized protein n=1 Tax=Termititenax aidoneus TaxID=2218524 RepID=A0A388TDC1_TERA1|nr:hypothetical protein NO1_2017 [Candidatus Termititenax aidoneus]
MRQFFTALTMNNTRDDTVVGRKYFQQQFQSQQPPQRQDEDDQHDFFGKPKPEYQTVGLTLENAEMTTVYMPDIEQIPEPSSNESLESQPPSINHEGLDREITTIYVSDELNYRAGSELIEELVRIGEENGFSVLTTATNGNIWVEDTTIRLHNGKVYIPNRTANVFYNVFDRDGGEGVIGSRKHISDISQGTVAQQPNSANQYIGTIPEENRVYGLSYLEGGNVLNCRLADGSPGAVIGAESIDYTMRAMELEDTPENREIAKKQIAKDLELPETSITYIPQFDFHIDMWFRPLQNGVMAVPDFAGGISMLTEILKSPDGITLEEKEKLEVLRDSLLIMEENTKQFIIDAEENLHAAGYETIKIPCFSALESAHPKNYKRNLIPRVNFMNGVGATNGKRETYYMTNTSGIPKLNDRIAQYFKEQAHIDNVYFMSSNNLQRFYGGFDCTTTEYTK